MKYISKLLIDLKVSARRVHVVSSGNVSFSLTAVRSPGSLEKGVK